MEPAPKESLPCPPSDSFGLLDFIDSMTECVERQATMMEQASEAQRLVSDLLKDDSWLPRELRRPTVERYARYPVYRDPRDRFEVIILVWLPGQGTPLHDHDGTWGAEGVLSGQLRVTRFERLEWLAGPRVRLRRQDDAVFRRLQTDHFLPPVDCHLVSNEGPETAITVHVYGKPVRRFRVFEPEANATDVYTIRLVRP